MKASSDAISSEIQRAEKTVSLLAKAIKAYQVYLPNNAMFQKAFEELRRAIQDFCFDNEALTLVVKEFELIYKNQIVYSNTDRMQSIAFKLYRDGIRLISFHHDVTEEELLAFIDAISKAQDHDRLQDDLVTLLWEKDLHGITYYEVNEMDTCSWQMLFQRDASFEGGLQGLPDLDTSQVLESMKWSSIENEVERLRPTLSFTTDELTQMQEIGVKEGSGSLRTLWQILLECLRMDRSIDCLSDLEPAIIAVLDRAMVEESIAFTNQALSNLQDICADIGGEANNIFSRILSSRSDPARFSIHAESLSRAGQEEKMDFIRYFSILGEEAVSLLIGIMDHCSSPTTLEICVSSLATVGSRCPHKLVEGSDLSEKQIEGILESLSRMIRADAKQVAVRFATHQSPKIKAKVAELLEESASKEAIDALKSMICDPNPLVKRRAMISLCKNPRNCTPENIIGLVLSDEFARLPHSSKLAVLISLRSLPSDTQKQVIKTILSKHSVFGRKKLEDTQIAAVEACAMLNKDVALDILGSPKGRVTRKVSKCISQVIERIENGKHRKNRESV